MLPPTLKAMKCTLFDYERSWKRYVNILQSLFADDLLVSFAPCDVTVGVANDGNRSVVFRDYDLHIFSYVCHETSSEANSNSYLFYKDLAKGCKAGAICLFLDVMGHANAVYDDIINVINSVPLRHVRVLERPVELSFKSQVLLISIEHVRDTPPALDTGAAVAATMVLPLPLAVDEDVLTLETNFKSAVRNKYPVVFTKDNVPDHLRCPCGEVGLDSLCGKCEACWSSKRFHF